MTDLVYLYDGSFAGFLCCVFESYANREIPTVICPEEEYPPTLFAVRTISTDHGHAMRVYKKVVKLSPYTAELLQKGYLTCCPEKEEAMFRMVKKLLRQGPEFLRNRADEVLYPVIKAVRHLEGEVHLLKGFTRFSDLGGVLGGEIAPKNRVLPLLRGHFCARYRNETFFLYDRTHHEALFYAAGKAAIRPLEDFQMAPLDEAEANYRLLWKRFYDTIAIKERYNPKCRRTQMPMRYWGLMTEFQDEAYFMAQHFPEGVSDPGAPAGIPAPGTLPESAPSAPGSSP